MANKFNLVYEGHPIMALNPAADAGGRSGLWAGAKFAHKAYIVAKLTQGNAAQVTFSFQQALNASGGSAKALSGNLNIWANQAVTQAASGDTMTLQTPGTSFQCSAALANKIVVFELVPEECFDLVNGFCYFQVITSASNAANITQADYFLIPARYAQQTALSDLV